MQLFYNKSLHSASTTLVFDKNESRHIVKVLRKKEGDLLYVTNGNNSLFTGEIINNSDKKCQINIINIETISPKRNYTINIAIAPTKNNERLEWFLEKGTEIGIDNIFPILCEHSERKVIKKERLEKVLVSALKQSLQHQLPKLQDITSLQEFLLKEIKGQKFIASCEEKAKNSLQNSIEKNQDVTVLIGPEGGFSPQEIELAIKQGFIPVSLGSTRLRTETAGLVAVHTVVLKNQS
jgi:16S rRNA (uracil1498-N3)-methyltransferase